MKAKIQQVNRYKVTIGDRTFEDFRKAGQWEGMIKFEHTTLGTLIVSAPESFDNIFAKLFGPPPTCDVVELEILKRSSILEKISMKTVEIGTQRHTVVQAADEPSHGGACHEYYISPVDERTNAPAWRFGHVQFQKGPVGENGVNGCQQEDLLAIVIHRLQAFQSGEFRCRENDLALTKLEEAMHWLNARTSERQKRGVEGTLKP